MKLYFSVVRRWWAVPAALVLLTLVCWVLGGTEVPVPGFLGGMVSMRVQYFTPLLVIGAVLYCLDRRLKAPEITAVVRMHRWDLTAVTAGVALCHLLGLIVGMDIPRNLMVLLAVALIVRRLGNEAAAGAACLLLLLVSASLGRAYQPSGQPTGQWWALTLYPSESPSAWIAAAVLFGLGLLASGQRLSSTRSFR
ncbi:MULTISPECIES: hypothetical protein [unclassified Streptomyces]|uniref:hypothetical protein n=1 Tax=unclassified Streptomyces TaxID=2593676 RepID=UPI000DACE53E|nr:MULTISPECIES: hypothetical protein [unclassified Streptomyces]MYU32795.1 hypothetical protein [Streptomyces sp. SID8358]MYX71890.1 hypothetical protein [Streptomyces sp. SID3915]